MFLSYQSLIFYHLLALKNIKSIENQKSFYNKISFFFYLLSIVATIFMLIMNLKYTLYNDEFQYICATTSYFSFSTLLCLSSAVNYFITKIIFEDINMNYEKKIENEIEPEIMRSVKTSRKNSLRKLSRISNKEKNLKRFSYLFNTNTDTSVQDNLKKSLLSKSKFNIIKEEDLHKKRKKLSLEETILETENFEDQEEVENEEDNYSLIEENKNFNNWKINKFLSKNFKISKNKESEEYIAGKI